MIHLVGLVIGLVIALFLSIGLGVWAIIALAVSNFRLRETIGETNETVEILRAGLNRPAIASMTADQVKDLATLIRNENGPKNWPN